MVYIINLKSPRRVASRAWGFKSGNYLHGCEVFQQCRSNYCALLCAPLSLFAPFGNLKSDENTNYDNNKINEDGEPV